MGGLKVRNLIATGASQSGARIVAYINGISPKERVFDAFLPLIIGGMASGFDDTVLDPNKIFAMTPGELAKLMRPFTKIRDDLNVPVLLVNSESETLGCFPCRQPDTDKFRFPGKLPVPRMAPSGMTELMEHKTKRDGVFVNQFGEARPSVVMWSPAADAAIAHLKRWIEGGVPPARQPLIAVSGNPPAIDRDEHGIAKGGVRLPDVQCRRAAIPDTTRGRAWKHWWDPPSHSLPLSSKSSIRAMMPMWRKSRLPRGRRAKPASS
jgi:hypothetical protein